MQIYEDELRIIEKIKNSIVQKVDSSSGITVIGEDNRMRIIGFGSSWRILINHKLEVTSFNKYNLVYTEKLLIGKKITSVKYSKTTNDLSIKLNGKIKIDYFYIEEDIRPWGVRELS